MGRLIDQLCAARDATFYQSPPGQSMLLFILTLLGGVPLVDPQIRPDRYLATVSRVHSTIEQLVRGVNMPEYSLADGPTWAIDDVLADCLHEMPKGASGWSPATERLVRHGVLIDSDGELRVVGEREVPSDDRVKQARADRDLWRELTALILEDQHLEQAVHRELDKNEG
jgi:hypothetical protein